MKKSRIISALLAALMLVAVGTGCSSGQAPTNNKTTGNAATEAPKATEAPAEGNEDTDTDTPAGEVVNLKWIMGNPGTIPKDQALVEEEMNKLSVPAIGVTVETVYMDNEQALLAVSTGEDFDMIFTCEWYNNYAVQAGQGYFADLTDILPTVAPDLYSFIPELVWKGSKVNGKIFAVPVYKDTAASQYWRFDKEFIVDELGMDISKYNTFDSIEEVLQKAKEARPDQYPLMTADGGVNGIDANFDMTNRDLYIGIPYSAEDDTKLVSTLEHPDFLNRLELLHKWYKAGYINPDAPNTKENFKISAVKTGQGFPGAEATWSAEDGFEVVITKYYGPVLSTASIRGSMNAINVNSANIEKSLEYMQYCNLTPEYRDLLRFGIKGNHYELSEEGTVKVLNDGYQPWGFSQATFFTTTPIYPAPANMWDLVKAENDAATATSSLGFAFDIEPVKDQVAACNNIFQKYNAGLKTGALDPATEVPKCLSELEAAGYREILAEAQSQLDAFLAANPS